jgi:hypothetical protein
MDKVQKHKSFNTNTPSSESYKNYRSLCQDGYSYTYVKMATVILMSRWLQLYLCQDGYSYTYVKMATVILRLQRAEHRFAARKY